MCQILEMRGEVAAHAVQPKEDRSPVGTSAVTSPRNEGAARLAGDFCFQEVVAMLLREKGTGREVEAIVSVDHASSSYGIPVVVIDGVALGPGEMFGYELLEVLTSERNLLREGGYQLKEVRS
jgi:hypothetical protein